MVKENWMITTYYPISRSTHNLKDMEFKKLKNSKYIFFNFEFLRILYHM